MKHITTVILLINGLVLSSAIQGQNSPQKKQFGAPNSVRTQGQKNRKTVRQPFGSKTNLGQKPQSGDKRKPQGPQTGMTKAKKGEHIVKVLELNQEQAQQLKAAHQEMGAIAKGIRGNNELSEEEKKAALREAHMGQRESLAGFLSEEQLAKLQEIHRQNAKPKSNKNKPKPGANIAKALGLSKEQETKLHKAREFTAKKIGSILKNKELSKEEKQEKIKEVHGTLRARREQILTEEQQAKLKELHEAGKLSRPQGGRQEKGRPQQGGQKGGQKGRPQGRPQQGGGQQGRPQGGGQQQGRPQGRPQGGGQQQGRPQGRPQGGGQQQGRPQGRPQGGGQQQGRPQGRPQGGGQQQGRPQPRNR